MTSPRPVAPTLRCAARPVALHRPRDTWVDLAWTSLLALGCFTVGCASPIHERPVSTPKARSSAGADAAWTVEPTLSGTRAFEPTGGDAQVRPVAFSSEGNPEHVRVPAGRRGDAPDSSDASNWSTLGDPIAAVHAGAGTDAQDEHLATASIKEDMAKHGVSVDIKMSQFYQDVVSGGADSGANGRYTFKTDTWINIDAEKALGSWPGLALSAHVETRDGKDTLADAGTLTTPNSAVMFPLPGDYDGTQVSNLLVSQMLFDG
jgi:hypothetical protein